MDYIVKSSPSRKSSKQSQRAPQKTFVLDTNVFLSDGNAIFGFDDNHIVIPMVVLEEVDRKKDRPDDVGYNARQLCRHLDELRLLGSLTSGVPLPGGGTCKVTSIDEFQGVLPDELNNTQPDNLIIAVAVGLRDLNPNSIVRLVTRDINMRIKCNVLGIDCDDYTRFRVAVDVDKIYRGWQKLTIPHDIVMHLRSHRDYQITAADHELFGGLVPNEFIIDEDANLTVRVSPDMTELFRVEAKDKDRAAFGIYPKNVEQQCAMRLLADDTIKLVTMVGSAGSGKTIIAVAHGLQLTIEESKYQKLVITRPIHPVGGKRQDIGFLPGDKMEKMSPWIQPIYDNFEHIMHRGKQPRETLNMWIEKGMVEIEAVSYMRGRSIANAFIIVDEAQNLSIHELKTIITRAGEGSKIVLTGDIEQVDNPLVDSLSNGLSYAIEKFKSQPIAGHITLTKGERSQLATIAAEIL